MKPKVIPGIPQQKEGSFHDTESCISFDDPNLASDAFHTLKKRFLSINEWKNYCGEKSADFKLYAPSGHPIERDPQEKDLIRIDIPGLPSAESPGFDWVKIVKLNDQFLDTSEIENLLMICVPTTTLGQDENNHIAHFYSEKSSSTFKIARGYDFIKIGIYGRNETPNLNTNFPGKVRNMLIAFGGLFRISKIQWKIFADELITF